MILQLQAHTRSWASKSFYAALAWYGVLWPCIACLQVYLRHEGRTWAAARADNGGGAPSALEHAPGNVPQLYVQYIGEGRHWRLADFDEHLEDPCRDWTNRQLTA